MTQIQQKCIQIHDTGLEEVRRRVCVMYLYTIEICTHTQDTNISDLFTFTRHRAGDDGSGGHYRVAKTHRMP